MIVIQHDSPMLTSHRLTTIGPAFRVCIGWKDGKKGKIALRKWMYVCQCTCGAISVREHNVLRRQTAKSCGCQQKEVAGALRRSHGMSNDPVYRNWRAMQQRCYDKSQKGYPKYGGRGIKVCDRWLEPGKGFQNFLEDMGPRPAYKRASVDRIDGNGDYCPENCRWATNKAQCNNRKTCIYVEYNGQRKTLTEWAESMGYQRKLFISRVRNGWDPIEAITTPKWTKGNPKPQQRKKKDAIK